MICNMVFDALDKKPYTKGSTSVLSSNVLSVILGVGSKSKKKTNDDVNMFQRNNTTAAFLSIFQRRKRTFMLSDDERWWNGEQNIRETNSIIVPQLSVWQVTFNLLCYLGFSGKRKTYYMFSKWDESTNVISPLEYSKGCTYRKFFSYKKMWTYGSLRKHVKY